MAEIQHYKSSRCLAGDNNKSVILLPEMVVTDFFKFFCIPLTRTSYFLSPPLICVAEIQHYKSSRCLAGDNNKSVILLPEMVVTDFLIFFCIPLTRSSLFLSPLLICVAEIQHYRPAGA